MVIGEKENDLVTQLREILEQTSRKNLWKTKMNPSSYKKNLKKSHIQST